MSSSASRPLLPRPDVPRDVDGTDQDAQQHGKVQKRKRAQVAAACERCRSRKHRCDGQRPTCSPCLEKSLQCMYRLPAGETHDSYRRRQVEQLHHNANELERVFQLIRHSPDDVAEDIVRQLRSGTSVADAIGAIVAQQASTGDYQHPHLSELTVLPPADGNRSSSSVQGGGAAGSGSGSSTSHKANNYNNLVSDEDETLLYQSALPGSAAASAIHNHEGDRSAGPFGPAPDGMELDYASAIDSNDAGLKIEPDLDLPDSLNRASDIAAAVPKSRANWHWFLRSESHFSAGPSLLLPINGGSDDTDNDHEAGGEDGVAFGSVGGEPYGGIAELYIGSAVAPSGAPPTVPSATNAIPLRPYRGPQQRLPEEGQATQLGSKAQAVESPFALFDGTPRAFGNLPLSSAISSNHYPPDVQVSQLRNFTLPEYSILPLSTQEDDALMASMPTAFRNAALDLISSGTPVASILGVDNPDFGGRPCYVDHFFDESASSSRALNVCDFACEMYKGLVQEFDPFVLLASVTTTARLMRWMILPSQSHFAEMPSVIRPLSWQRFVPHSPAIDLCASPGLRRALLEEYRDFVYSCSHDVGRVRVWPFTMDEAVEIEPSSGRRRLTRKFESWIAEPSNWSWNVRVLETFPELQNYGVQIRSDD